MKALFVGLGAVGQRHLRNLLTLQPKYQILSFREIGNLNIISDNLEIESNKNLEEKYHIRNFPSLDEALKEKPDLTFICNPSSCHIEVAIKAAESGSNIFVEKPLSSNTDGVEKLLKAVDQNKIISSVGFQLRFNPLIQKVKEILKSRILGKILSARLEVCEYLPNFHTYEDYRDTYAAKKSLGGGVVLSQIHEIDLFIYFFGLPNSLFAIGGKRSSLEIDVEDSVDILLAYKDMSASIYMDFLQKDKRRVGTIYGEQGLLEYNLNTLELKTNLSGKITKIEIPKIDRNDMFLEELRYFLRCTEQKRSSKIDVKEGLKSLLVANAVKESFKENKVVVLEK